MTSTHLPGDDDLSLRFLSTGHSAASSRRLRPAETGAPLRRFAHLATLARWGALAVLAGAVLSDLLGTARAQGREVSLQADTVVEALNTMNRNLAVFGMFGEVLQDPDTREGLSQIKTAFQSRIGMTLQRDPAVQMDFLSFLVETGRVSVDKPSQPPREWATRLSENDRQQLFQTHARPEVVQEYVVNRTTGTLVDTVVLMTRVRQDSDQFRQWLEGEGLKPVLQAIESELSVLNQAMVSVPAMATQMDVMNRQVVGMNYSVGSTMGRVGSWLPW
ncbi:MAG: hypothetical protein QNJ82_11365 [Gammaproteobacteria bacterium]|nr:hypothetical protein [Gammaproteobacteria bacterium]